jgi:transcriptional regulator GlxA family with amidase domain
MSIKEERKRASKRARKRPSSRSLRIDPPHVVPESTIRDPRIQVVIDFLNANLDRRIRLAELAEKAKVSSSRVSHIFKTAVGLSPGEYLRRLRMEKARHLIATSPLRIKEIMAMAGYYSKSHFVRHFRKSFGLAPSEYRKAAST